MTTFFFFQNNDKIISFRDLSQTNDQTFKPRKVDAGNAVEFNGLSVSFGFHGREWKRKQRWEHGLMPPSTQRPIASPSGRDAVFPQHFILKELNMFPSPGGYFKKRKAMYCAVWVNAGSAMAAIIAKAHGSMDNYPSLDWIHSQILLTLTGSSQVQWVWRPPRNRYDPERPCGWV